jgi:apolipoprotein N-acyltransferase
MDDNTAGRANTAVPPARISSEPMPSAALKPPPRHIESVTGHVALTGVTAVLYAAAYPHPGWWPLIWVALAPLAILAARSARPWVLAGVAAGVFLAFWLARISWMIPVTVGGWIGLSLIMTAWFVLAAMVLHLLSRRTRLPMTLLLPMVWVSVEFLRGTLPAGGFGWFALSHALAPYHPDHAAGRLVQIADLFGEWTVSVLVCMTSGLIADTVIRPWYRGVMVEGKRTPRWRLRRTMRAALFAWALAVSSAWFYGQMRLSQTDRVTTPGVAVAVVQTNVPQSNKNFPTPADDRRRWTEMVSLTRAAAAMDPRPRLIAWPETMVPGAINPEAVEDYRWQARDWERTRWEAIEPQRRVRLAEIAAEWGVEPAQMPAELAAWYADKASYARLLRDLSAELGVPLIVGSPTEAVLDGRANSAFLVYPSGHIHRERYDKVHLVPFGEYIPWVSASEVLLDLFIRYLSPYPHDYSLTPGRDFVRFSLHDPAMDIEAIREPEALFATPICFEDAVPAVTRAMVYDGGSKVVQLLVNLTNDGWFAGTAQPWQHLQLATLRSIETRVPTARSVNTGVSGFIDSAGRVGPLVTVEGVSVDVAGAVVHVVRFDPRHTLFAVVGRVPVALLAVMTGLLAVVALYRGRSRPGDAEAIVDAQ